jgi:glycosyltransferase involved in cell wall biosynthesis
MATKDHYLCAVIFTIVRVKVNTLSKPNQKSGALISIVTVVFNREHEIESTIRSVLDQTYQDFEYLVIDGGSKDGTVELIKKYSSSINYWISERDKGIYDAMNKGARAATGEWIIFMNAGDLFYNSSVLENCASILKSSSDKLMVYGDAEIISGEHKHVQYQHDRHLDLTKSIIHQSTFVRRVYLQENPYDTRYRVMADYDNLLKVSVLSPDKCVHVNEIICRYDKTGVSSRPLYTYFKEYYAVARTRMPFLDFVGFNLYILPRLIWSYRLALK